jgi:hypothetical protein
MTSQKPKALIKVKTLFFYFAVLVMSTLSGLRVFGYDRDYFSYLRFYEKVSLAIEFKGRFEPGFQLFAKFTKVFIDPDSFGLFLFITAFVSLYLKLSILKNAKHYILLVTIYFMLIFPLHEMMQIRISMASGIMYWTLNKSLTSTVNIWIKSLLVCVGISFHYSAIILAPFILNPGLCNSRSKLWITAVMICPILLINAGMGLISKLIPIVDLYINQINLLEEVDINPYSSRNIIFVTVSIIGLVNIKHISKDMLPWFYLSLLGLSLWYSFIWFPVFAHRLLELTVFSYLVWVPSLPGYSKFVSLSLLLILAVYFLIRTLVIAPMFSSVV